MHILRVASDVYPEVTGGVGLHVHYLSKYQAEEDHNVTILTSDHGDRNKPQHEAQAGYTIRRHRQYAKPLGNSLAPGVLSSIFELQDDADILHIHSHLFFSSNMAATLGRFLDLPVVITNHGLFTQQDTPAYIDRLHLKTLGKLTFNSADRIHCYTENAKEQCSRYGITPEKQVIRNGIDHTRFTPDGEKYDKIDNDGTVILAVLRLVKGKRPKDAIDIIDTLQEEHPDVTLYLCGDGHLRDTLEEYVHMNGLDEYVTFLGQIEYERMPQLYRTCDIVLLPSETEGCPRVILEALATEKPFVMSNLETNAKALTEVGMTAEIGNIAEFSEKLSMLISNPSQRDTIGERGRELIEEEFNWQKTATKTTQSLVELVERN